MLFPPKSVKRLFPLQLYVYLRNLRGRTSHEIMQIKDCCHSPNSFSIFSVGLDVSRRKSGATVKATWTSAR